MLPFQIEIADVTIYKCLCYLILCVGILPKGSLDSLLHPPHVYLLILAKSFIFSQNSLSLLLADM